MSVPIIAALVLGYSSINNPFADYPPYLQVVMFYLTGLHLLPLWFIPMIFIFYLLAPLLIAIDRHPRFYAVLPILLIVSSLVPRSLTNVFDSSLHFISVYVLGMFCSHYRLQVLAIIEKYLGIIIAAMLILIGLDAMQIAGGFGDQHSPGSVGALGLWAKLLLSLALMQVLYRFDSVIGKRFDLLAATSFGVYFVHQYFIELLGRFVPVMSYSTIAKLGIFAGFSTVVLILSVGTLILTKKIFGRRSRYLVGY